MPEFAYKNEREAKKKERRDADIGAVLETTLYLHMMWNEVPRLPQNIHWTQFETMKLISSLCYRQLILDQSMKYLGHDWTF